MGTMSTVFPSSTDYWKTTSFPRAEKTVWIISALWNEILHTHKHTHSDTYIHTYTHTYIYIYMYTYAYTTSHNHPYLCKYISLSKTVKRYFVFLFEGLFELFTNLWTIVDLFVFLLVVCQANLWYIKVCFLAEALIVLSSSQFQYYWEISCPCHLLCLYCLDNLKINITCMIKHVFTVLLYESLCFSEPSSVSL